MKPTRHFKQKEIHNYILGIGNEIAEVYVNALIDYSVDYNKQTVTFYLRDLLGGAGSDGDWEHIETFENCGIRIDG